MSVQGTMFNPYMNYYSSYATMGDLYGFDDYNYTAMGNPFAYGGGYGFNGINYQQYYNNMIQMQDFYSQYAIHNAQTQRTTDITINNVDSGLRNAFEALQTKIVSNEQEQIQGALENFKNAVRAKYPNVPEEYIANYTSDIYRQMSGGTSLPQDIQAYGSSSFWQGFKQALGLGIFADNKTASENIAEITGQPVSRTDQMAKVAGTTLGGVAAGAAAGAAIGLCGGPMLAGVGAVVGGIYGLAKGLFGF